MKPIKFATASLYMVQQFDMLCTIKLKQQIVASDRLHILKLVAHVK